MTTDQNAEVIVHCDRCGRKLKDETSKERRIGPVCERKRAEGDWA